MNDLKSILPRVCARGPRNAIRELRVKRQICRALRSYARHQSPACDPTGQEPGTQPPCGLRDLGYTPHAEMRMWRRRFFGVLAAFMLLLIGCIYLGTGAL